MDGSSTPSSTGSPDRLERYLLSSAVGVRLRPPPTRPTSPPAAGLGSAGGVHQEVEREHEDHQVTQTNLEERTISLAAASPGLLPVCVSTPWAASTTPVKTLRRPLPGVVPLNKDVHPEGGDKRICGFNRPGQACLRLAESKQPSSYGCPHSHDCSYRCSRASNTWAPKAAGRFEPRCSKLHHQIGEDSESPSQTGSMNYVGILKRDEKMFLGCVNTRMVFRFDVLFCFKKKCFYSIKF